MTPARAVVTDARGRFYAPARAWAHHAEFDRNEHPFEARYFHTSGDELIEVPAGKVSIEVMKGPGGTPQHRELQVPAATTTEAAFALPSRPWLDGVDRRWVSADAHVHMNYGGRYRNTPAHLVFQAEAEDLDIVENLIVNKEQRVPDIAYSGHGVDPASGPGTLVVHGRPTHTSYWGHLGILGPRGGILLPGYAGYPNTAAAFFRRTPTSLTWRTLRGHWSGTCTRSKRSRCRSRGRRIRTPTSCPSTSLWARSTTSRSSRSPITRRPASVWYRLLNLGFKLPAAGGTDAMADYATLRGPVGLNRVYASVANGPLDSEAWLAALRQGRTFATNGPLLDFSLGGTALGATVQLERAQEVPFTARMRSIVPVDHAQIICNGQLARELALGRHRDTLEVSGRLLIKNSGWCLLRAFSAHAQYPVLDNFVYATTSPVYVAVRGAPLRAPADARFFEAWIEHLQKTTAAYPDWNSASEKTGVLQKLEDAHAAYRRLE